MQETLWDSSGNAVGVMRNGRVVPLPAKRTRLVVHKDGRVFGRAGLTLLWNERGELSGVMDDGRCIGANVTLVRTP